MLTILEHKSASYSPRTYHNASVGDITIAIAVDDTKMKAIKILEDALEQMRAL